ncbi:MAG: hypothetical protein JWP34_5339, partial [Massilia sp.]|nr:hypothetical protein [Massilia sp.]
MSHVPTAHSHPSHHPPNTIPPPSDAPSSTAHLSDDLTPFTDVLGRSKKTRKSAKRDALQSTLDFAIACSTPSSSPLPTVSVDIVGRVEEKTESPRSKPHATSTTPGQEPASGVHRDEREEQEQSGRSSSPSANQHSASASLTIPRTHAPTPSAVSGPTLSSLATQQAALPSLPQPGSSLPSSTEEADDDDVQMRAQITTKRTRDTSTSNSTSSTHTEAATSPRPLNALVHPARHALIGARQPSPGDKDDVIDQATPGPNTDKRRRTLDKPTEVVKATDASPQPSDWEQLTNQLQACQQALTKANAQLEALSSELAQLRGAPSAVQSQIHLTSSLLSALPAPPAPRVQPPLPAQSQSQSTGAPHMQASPASPSPRVHRAPHHSVAEPSSSMLNSLGLSEHSPTDLLLKAQFAPLSISMRRPVRLPSFRLRPIDHRAALVNVLQDKNALQLAPPRVPTFLTKARGGDASVAALKETYSPDSREYCYLASIEQAQVNGDDFDPLHHSFTDTECITSWHQLLTNETRAIDVVHQQRLSIHLAILNPILTQAVRMTVEAHTARTQAALKRSTAAVQRPLSPTPSVASTVSADPSSPAHSTDAMEEDECKYDEPLQAGAIHSTVTVLPFRLQYVSCLISNWPRAHPTELCGGNSQLTAFMREYAPNVRLVTKQENGITSASTTAVCLRQHLTQIVGLTGTTSPEHGVHQPLHLRSSILLMGARTCTFCWKPNHGATRCPHHKNSTAPKQPTSARPACRHCYSFEHTTVACTIAAPSKCCTLCLATGHSTPECRHFFPGQMALSEFLSPPTGKALNKPASAATSSSQQATPGPILTTMQSRAQKPWQMAGQQPSRPNPMSMAPRSSAPD